MCIELNFDNDRLEQFGAFCEIENDEIRAK